MSTNIIWKNAQHDQSYVKDFKPELDEGFNDYTIEWTPEYVHWKVNGKVVRVRSNSPDVTFLNKAHHIIMDFWSPTVGSWSKDFRPEHMPFYCKYNYVKIEKYNEKTKKFENYHRDDFNTLDENFWQVSDGWGSGTQTSSIYYKSQVYIERGNLVFKMEKDPRHFDAVEEEPEEHVEDVEEPNTDSDFKTDFGGQDEPVEQPGMIQKLIKFFTN